MAAPPPPRTARYPIQQPPEARRPEESAALGPASARALETSAPDKSRLFPYNSVVGIVDDAARLEAAVQALLAAAFAEGEVHVLAGEAGVRQIDAKGERQGLLGRLFRLVDGMGEEREHRARDVEALQEGRFILTIDTPDDVAKARARDALVAHGGHFVRYYSRWTSEALAP
jgi:hypothetical protein